MLPSLLAAIGLMLALTLSLRTGPLVAIAPDSLWNSGLIAVIAAFVSSRLLLVLDDLRGFLHYPVLLLTLPSLPPTAILLTLIATALWLRWKRLLLLAALDAWAPCATLLWSFLALGHFLAASDPGLPSRFGVRLRGAQTPLAPVALYVAAFASVLTAVLVLWLPHRRRAGDTAALALAVAGLAQFLFTFLRQPDPSRITTLLDPIQWLSVGMIVTAAGLLAASQPLPQREA
jgi:phosphatidylglycerol:prolipoprotein diacylglycerol transferase